MPAFKDITGHRFGRLTAIRYLGNRTYLCRCDCGHEKPIARQSLVSGKSKSCKCYQREIQAARKLKHGKARTGTYRTWVGMMHRCLNPTNKRYSTYGGRGIKIHESWTTFDGFYADMGDRPPGMSLDRIDNGKGYSPDNCRWASVSQQQRNKRSNALISYRGESLPIVTWAERFGVPYHIIWNRSRAGWNPERIFSDLT